MRDAAPQAIFLKDYQAPDFAILSTELEFDLYEDHTIVRSNLRFKRTNSKNTPLRLHGQDIELIDVQLDEQPLDSSNYVITEESLEISSVPDEFVLSCTTKIKPQENTSLEGLYKSNKMFCTQCEAEGFRKITYYLDRPDSLSVFCTKIIADKNKYPVLLSNGNLVGQGDAGEGRHWVEWSDPFKKPSYLFALVAGDLEKVEDKFTTCSGREVKIEIFVEAKDLDKCDHAVAALKNAMKWDEEVYGREYDLDIYMIVAVDDFNMGAMENKGLNIFNTSCVLAKPSTTTDAGFQRVEGVVAHEYFHNWSGNRVTCRDWFQLSLKEGFTVFRDEEFSSDMGSRTVKRVEDVQVMRNLQFVEDAGPMAHPVQPSSFIEISNFYTLTVYEKGSEIVRMIHTLLGPDLFRKGSDLYFERHDGQAVTIEDFVAAMADVSGRDFSQFMHWYKQAGTPSLSFSDDYNAETKQYRLHVKQSHSDSPGHKKEDKQTLVIPLHMGLLGSNGELDLNIGSDVEYRQIDGKSAIVVLTDADQTLVFDGVEEKPVPSLLRNFSAPVKFKFGYSEKDLLRLMSADRDGFVRWNSSQELALKSLFGLVEGRTQELSPLLVEGAKTLLEDQSLDPAMVALMLNLPSESYMGDLQDQVQVEANHQARNQAQKALAHALKDQFLASYSRYIEGLKLDDGIHSKAIALRSLKNVCLDYLMLTDEAHVLDLAEQQFKTASNMTDELGALKSLVHSPFEAAAPLAEAALQDFYERWKGESLVVNLWLQVQATSPSEKALELVLNLLDHEAFNINNPNKVRALIGAFSNGNAVRFHAQDGSGYKFLADQIVILNAKNPQIASRLVTPLTKWRRYDEARAKEMKAQLKRIADLEGVSKDVYEVVSKSLESN